MSAKYLLKVLSETREDLSDSILHYLVPPIKMEKEKYAFCLNCKGRTTLSKAYMTITEFLWKTEHKRLYMPKHERISKHAMMK